MYPRDDRVFVENNIPTGAIATRLSVSSPLSAAVWRTPFRSPFQSMSWWNNSGWPFSKWPFPVWRRGNVWKKFQKHLFALTLRKRQDEREEQIPQIHSHMLMGESLPRVIIMGPEAHSVTCLLTLTLSLTQSEHCMFRVLWQMQGVCVSIQIGELKT